jgi:hypothetical protein
LRQNLHQRQTARFQVDHFELDDLLEALEQKVGLLLNQSHLSLGMFGCSQVLAREELALAELVRGEERWEVGVEYGAFGETGDVIGVFS